ncbi:uncharacterized protein [Epargyreus clarus]|uniref:uncharacterized protein n=1 Tax=Epargyreus clarus TaxID=520877 RepID=UPI003C2BAA86
MTISKIRKICSVSLIPRILRDEFTLPPRKLGKRPLDGFWKMNKSTDSKDKQAECEKCRRLIEMVFGPEKPEPVLKQVEANLEDIHIDKMQKAIAPSIPMKERLNESGGVAANHVLSVENKEKESADNAQLQIKKPVEQIGLDILKSTTAKDNKEELAQKLETIEEPALVEAGTPKIEGFNTPPKVLGDRETKFDIKNSLCTKIGPEEDAMDEIAKKCLGSPPDRIDERIIEEMKSCGMLGRGRRKSSRRHGSYLNKSNKKDTLLETKSDESTLYSEKQKVIESLYPYPSIPCHNMKFSQHPENVENVYPTYFKNVPIDIVGDGRPDQKTEKENVIKHEEAETKLLSAGSPALVDSYQQIPVVAQHTYNSQEVSEEVDREKSESVQIVAHEEVKSECEKDLQVEEIHVTPTETRQLQAGKAEIDIDVDQKPIKPDILTCNQILRATETPMVDTSFVADKRESHVTFAKQYSSDQWGYDLPDRPFNNPSTSISGTYTPEVRPKRSKREVKDTAISSQQNPGEYFDISRNNMEKLDAYAINPSTIRPLEAYHPYTIISGADNEKSANLLFSTKEPSNVPDVPSQLPVTESPQSNLPPQVEKPDPSNKNLSSTMGPVPELKEIEDEISLSEMLKKVRERNRLQFYRECTEYKALETEPVEANKCTDPIDKEAKTLGPGPCKPKPKSECPPPPKKCPPCPPPCPPPCKQKDPCAKFTKTSLIGYKVKEAFSLVLSVGLKPNCDLLKLAYNHNIKAIEPLRLISNVQDAYKIEKLGSFLLIKCLKRKLKQHRNEDVILAKDYEPWVPIPSWPIPKKEKKEPFVCPKEGCKLIPPPRLNPPCKENPCINMPKRSFTMIDPNYELLYLYNDKL